MKKNIAIGLLAALSLVFFTFSYLQKKRADEMQQLAEKYRGAAIKEHEEVLRQTSIAEQRQTVIDDLMKKNQK